jgi:hypothetical protein
MCQVKTFLVVPRLFLLTYNILFLTKAVGVTSLQKISMQNFKHS